MAEISVNQLASIMDTSIVEPDASENEVTEFVNEMKHFPFAGIAVDLYYLPLLVKLLKGTDIDAIGTVSYPLGGVPTRVKVEQVKWAVKNGADEMDVVMNVSAFRSGKYDAVEKEIGAVVEAAEGRIVKIIPMTCFLTPEEIKRIGRICKGAGAIFIKTCSGFGQVTKYNDVKIIKDDLGDSFRVMVAGGVRNADIALQFIKVGVDRIATSTPSDIFNTLGGAQKKFTEAELEKLAKRVEQLNKESSQLRRGIGL